MKKIILTKAKNTMLRASSLKIIGQDGLKRLQEDINRKEYVVFVKPLAGRLKQVLHRNDDSETEELDVESASQASVISQDEADSRLVDEVFVQPVPSVELPEKEADKNQEITEQPQDSEVERSTVEATAEIDPEEIATPVARPSNVPLVRTMVEAIPEMSADEDGLNDFLFEDLKEIFTVTSYANPRTKALLKNREPVDIHELAKELQEYAESIGASPRER